MFARTLQSIAQQQLLPDKCFVFLSEDAHLQDTGFKDRQITDANLIKLINNHPDLFEIQWVENTGPYRKLLPLLQQKRNEDCAIITIDDDAHYKPDFVAHITADYIENKCCVSYRCFDHGIKSLNEFTRYNIKGRTSVKNGSNNPLYFTTGRGGVLYTPSMFSTVLNVLLDKQLYMQAAPTADDVWFNFLRAVCDIPVVGPGWSSTTNKIRGGNKHALSKRYNFGGGNNKALKNTIQLLNDIKTPEWKNI